MAHIVCFADSPAVISAVRQDLSGHEHDLHFMAASQLTGELRRTVQRLAPDVILMELSQAIDNPHLYFFLRSDQATRNIPIILLSGGTWLAHQAAVLGADGYLQRPFAADQLRRTVSAHLQPQRALAAA
jgi:CheY-like chemotaxis protein